MNIKKVNPHRMVIIAIAPQIIGRELPKLLIALNNEEVPAILVNGRMKANPIPYEKVDNKKGHINGLNVSPLELLVTLLKYLFILNYNIALVKTRCTTGY